MIRISDERIQEFEKKHIGFVREKAAECTLFLKRENSDFPLEKAGDIAAYGAGVRRTIKGGIGSGDVNIRHAVSIEEGLENAGFNITTGDWIDAYEKTVEEEKKLFNQKIRDTAKERGISPIVVSMEMQMGEPEYEIAIDRRCDTAIYCLSRNSGEGKDRLPQKGDIELTDTEVRDILKINSLYDRFLLVLNVGGLVDLTPVLEVKNILLLGQLGTPTGDILADILLGKQYPSGKLSMTWAAIKDYPSTEGFGGLDDTFYNDGIYVGYRYFDNVPDKIIYPFGFGLGYTDFKIDGAGFEADEGKVVVEAQVENIGQFKGKEVVQVYVAAPSGRIDKPCKELKAFSKTAELAPGEKSKVRMTIPVSDLASYDEEKSCYVLEGGKYSFLLGNSSCNSKQCGVIEISKEVSVLQLKSITNGKKQLREITFSGAQNEAGESTKCILIDADKIKKTQACYTEATETGASNSNELSFKDIIEGKCSVEDFACGLSDQELAYICTGHFEDSQDGQFIIGAACRKVAGGAGQTTGFLNNRELPALTMVDGPAGIRISEKYKLVDGKPVGLTNPLAGFEDFMDPEALSGLNIAAPEDNSEGDVTYYSYCTAIPIGTALAQSWNEELVADIGDIIGDEMEKVGVTYWLAPAMNIMRNPLCGRNFEYYSEDPLLSGLIGAAMTKGVQQHKGCATTIKHYACNNQETNRSVSNSVVSERALREIYLKTFEISIKKAQPLAVMTSYNLLNGEHTCNSVDIIDTVLRKEWRYEGIVMTDWYSTQGAMPSMDGHVNKYKEASAAGCIKAGNDIVMPGSRPDVEDIMTALKDENHKYHITRSDLIKCAKRILGQMVSLG